MVLSWGYLLFYLFFVSKWENLSYFTFEIAAVCEIKLEISNEEQILVMTYFSFRVRYWINVSLFFRKSNWGSSTLDLSSILKKGTYKRSFVKSSNLQIQSACTLLFDNIHVSVFDFHSTNLNMKYEILW